MELTSMACRPSCSAMLRAHPRNLSLPTLSSSAQFCSQNLYFRGCYINVNKLHRPLYAADIKNASVLATNLTEEQIQPSDSPDPNAFQEGAIEDSENTNKKDDLDSLDGQKMTRICDKLIDIFLVDKPTPNDWRRLLTFSREWDNLRAHFYQRCQDRADVDDNPEMKHKLLRLGRKLKEIDEDLQRHNELLEVVRGAPSEISDIVARRRKDFTNEFFVHVHTVAESYYDKPEEQNG